MDKHKLKDFIDATKEEAGNVAVEEVLPAVVKEAGGFIVSEGVGMLASEIVGAVVPVANNIRLSYKQNRLERNVVEALQIVQRNQDELENKIVKLQQETIWTIKDRLQKHCLIILLKNHKRQWSNIMLMDMLTY